MNLTVLVDNHCGDYRLRGEHGLSMFIETPRGKVLFDTGMGWSLLHNMQELKVSIDSIDHIILSHGHYDHTWGLGQLLLRRPEIPVWAHETFDAQHFSKKPGRVRYIGPSLCRDSFNYRAIAGTCGIIEDLWAIPVPPDSRNPDFIPVDRGLVIRDKNDRFVRDTMEDDVSLLVKGRFGYSVILGCAHAGVVNILEVVKEITGSSSFYSVIGGTHFNGQSEDFVERSADYLRSDFNIKNWFPNHCTGVDSATTMARILRNVSWAPSGKKIEL